jgi:hypothetical protein
MTSHVLALTAAYVVLAVVLAGIGLTARWRWQVKAAAILVLACCYGVVFYQSRALLGWPAVVALPQRFQLLWVRIVEPSKAANDPGAIFLWLEDIDVNNIASGEPRAYRLPYSQDMANASIKARARIEHAEAVMGTAIDMLATAEGGDRPELSEAEQDRIDQGVRAMAGRGAQIDVGAAQGTPQHIDFVPLPPPVLPSKGP